MVSDKRAIIHPRVSENPRQQWRGFVMYAELTGNREKQRIKSLCDNKLKKKPKEFKELTEQFFENAKEKNLSKNLTDYVWNVLVKT